MHEQLVLPVESFDVKHLLGEGRRENVGWLSPAQPEDDRPRFKRSVDAMTIGKQNDLSSRSQLGGSVGIARPNS